MICSGVCRLALSSLPPSRTSDSHRYRTSSPGAGQFDAGRDTPTSRAAPLTLQPRSRNSMNRRRFSHCGRRPGLFHTRRDAPITTPQEPHYHRIEAARTKSPQNRTVDHGGRVRLGQNRAEPLCASSLGQGFENRTAAHRISGVHQPGPPRLRDGTHPASNSLARSEGVWVSAPIHFLSH